MLLSTRGCVEVMGGEGVVDGGRVDE
jgi:hypothetical protein